MIICFFLQIKIKIKMPNYGDPDYWEERYKNQDGKTFDWLEDYETLKSIMSDFKIDKGSCKVLNLGCGNAEMSEDMYKDGYLNNYNIDISKEVIDQMKERNSENKIICKFFYNFLGEVMDVRDLKYENDFFDMVVDKSTIDAILCGECSFINVAKMLKEVDRVLKVDGIYMIISYGQPENRVFHLERNYLNFEVTIYTIKKDYQIDDEDEEKEKFEKVSIFIIIFKDTLCLCLQKNKKWRCEGKRKKL